MQTTTILACVLAIGSGVFYYQKTETQIDQLQQELETMQHDHWETQSYIAHLTGLLRHQHIKYGDNNDQRK